MTNSNKNTVLSPEQISTVLDRIERATTLQDLICTVIKATNIEMLSYHHFSGPGHNDDKNMPRHFSHNLPAELEEFLNTHEVRQDYPSVNATFSSGKPLWISDLLEYESVKGFPYENNIKSLMDLTTDGLIVALFGPSGRKGYAFISFKKPKSHFNPVFEWQIHAMLQMLHVRYCLMLIELQKKVVLTKRESEVLGLIALGKTNPEIGIILDISKNTVASYLKRIFLKLETSDRVTAVLRARALNLLP